MQESRNSNIEQLRNRATAYLAKEEKEFRATVVLSQDRTIYIPNHENVGKRNKRVPKRFHDSVETPFAALDAICQPPLPAPARKSKADNNRFNDNPLMTPVSKAKRSRLQTELDKMTHCNVSLLKMPTLDSLEPWCMVHCLYKCFCKLKVTSGKRFTFDEPGAIIAEPDESYAAPPKKRQYTFEKPAPAPAEAEKPASTEKSSTSIQLLKKYEFQAARTKPFTLGRTMRSRKEIKKMHAMYRQVESDNPGLKKLLNSHKRRCWMYAGEKVYVVDPERSSKNVPTENIPNTVTMSLPGDSLLKPMRPPVSDYSKPGPMSSKKTTTIPTQQMTLSSLPTVFQKRSQSVVHPVRRPSTLVATESSASAPTATSNTPASSTITKPTSEESKSIHDHNMKYFNYCVNRTMEQVKSAQINTVVVKAPQPKNLNCIQWNRLVPLFQADKVFVWEIQLETLEVILGLTVANVMPIVPGALSAMNIKVVQTNRLPLVAQLLKQGMNNPGTAQMAVLLYGSLNYWQIISIIHSHKNYMEEDHRVQPTPRTHPQLANKIAKLFSMLTRKRANERKRQQLALLNKASQSAPAIAPAIAQPLITENQASQRKKFGKSGALIIPKFNIIMTPDRNIASFLPVLPEVGIHKWFMLTLADDFTHIFIRSWNSFLSHDKIKSAVKMAKRFGKTVKISAPNIIPDVFAAPSEPGKVFFGPYAPEANLEMGLYYTVNKKILPSDEYFSLLAQQQGLKGQCILRSSGCWLKVLNPRTPTDVQEPTPGPSSACKKISNGDESDDDCMIVESQPEVISIPEEEEEQNGIREAATLQNRTDNVEVSAPTMISLSPPASLSYQSTIHPDETNARRSLLKINATPPANVCMSSSTNGVSNNQLPSDQTAKQKFNKISIMASMKKPSSKSPPKSQPNPSILPPLSITLQPNNPFPPAHTPLAVPSNTPTPPISEQITSFVDIALLPRSSSNLTIIRLPNDQPTIDNVVQTTSREPIPSNTSNLAKQLGTMKLPKSLTISTCAKRASTGLTDTLDPPPGKQSRPNHHPMGEPTAEQSVMLEVSECIDLDSDEECINMEGVQMVAATAEALPEETFIGKGFLVCHLGRMMGRLEAEAQHGQISVKLFDQLVIARDMRTVNRLVEE